MAEIKSFPNNQDIYIGAEWVMKWLHGRTSGVFGAENNLAVTPVVDSMSVQVSDGIGWLSNINGDGVVFWNDNEQANGIKLALTHDAADGALDRIDRIVITWETTNYVALPTISVLKGTASSSPVAPTLTNDNTQRQISIAKVSIPAGTVSLTADMITDERLDAAVCGLVTEAVEIDTSMMQNQFNAMLDNVQNELANIVGGTGFDPSPIREENIVVAPNAFVEFTTEDTEESKMISLGFKYRAAVDVANVLDNMTPYMTFSLYDVEESGVTIANQFKCYDGGVYVYSDNVPDISVTILTAEFRKAVA